MSEAGSCFTGREIYPTKTKAGGEEGKDEIIVEMSEMCLRALQFCASELTTVVPLLKEDFGLLLRLIITTTVDSGGPQMLRSSLRFGGCSDIDPSTVFEGPERRTRGVPTKDITKAHTRPTRQQP